MRYLKNGYIGLLAMALLSTTPAHGATTTQQHGTLGWLVQGSLEFGGDEVARVQFTDNSSQGIKAGQGFGLSVGGHYRFANSNFDLGATLGLKYAASKASNADIHLNRMVIEFTGTYWLNDDWWLAAGPVFHQSIKLNGDGLGPDIKFDDASGVTFKAGWRWVGLTYTNIKYDAAAPFSGRADASNFGVVGIGRF